MAGMRLLSAQGDLRQGVDHHHETDRRHADARSCPVHA
jgi:hypothetical protein